MNVESLVNFGGVVVVALLSFFSAIYVANRQAKAGDNDVQHQVDEALWQRTQQQLAKMSARIDALEKSDEEKDAQISKLKAENALQKANMSEMAKRLKDLEQDRDHWKQRALTAEERRAKGGKEGL